MIYVSICSYRDPLLQSTINDLFAKADNPDNIFVGCFIQTSDKYSDHNSCLVEERKNLKFEIGIPGETFGINICRNKALQWIGSEHEFVFQMDSHMRFKQGWDTKIIESYKSLNNDKALISTTTTPWYINENLEEVYNSDDNIITIQEFNNKYAEDCFKKFYEFIPEGISFDAKSDFHKGWYLCGHYIFGKANYFIENPQEEWILFWGEELINSIKAFINGWDVYVPAKKYAYHMFPQHMTHTKLNKIWNDFPENWKPMQMETNRKIIGYLNSLDKKERSYDDLVKMLGYDMRQLFNLWYNDVVREEKNVDSEIIFEELAPGIISFKNVYPRLTNLLEHVIEAETKWLPAQVLIDNAISGEDYSQRNTDMIPMRSQENPHIINFAETFHKEIWPYIDAYQRQYGAHIESVEEPQLLRYGVGQEFKNHIDDHPKIGVRRISLSYYLNDDYEGGEILFPRFNVSIKPEANQLVIFPSNFVFNHTVMPVTSGTRYAVVQWMW